MSATTTFFRSRWTETPAHVTELEPHVLPAGFRAAGVAAGLKPEGLDARPPARLTTYLPSTT